MVRHGQGRRKDVDRIPTRKAWLACARPTRTRSAPNGMKCARMSAQGQCPHLPHAARGNPSFIARQPARGKGAVPQAKPRKGSCRKDEGRRKPSAEAARMPATLHRQEGHHATTAPGQMALPRGEACPTGRDHPAPSARNAPKRMVADCTVAEWQTRMTMGANSGWPPFFGSSRICGNCHLSAFFRLSSSRT